jgi:protein SCO1
MNPRMRALLAIAALLAAGALAACEERPRRPTAPDDYGAMPSFTFTDQTGGTLTEEWLRGRVTIVDFIFTRCDTICPVLTWKMVGLAEQTRDLDDRIRLLSFSVDPVYDTPAVLAAYADRYRVDPARWRFVTGDYPRIEALVTGALMTAMEPAGTTASGAPDIRHGGHFLLIGPDLRIRGVYDSSDEARLTALVRDARRLAR